MGYNPVRMRTRVRMAGSALIRRDDNLVYADNTPTPQVWIGSLSIGAGYHTMINKKKEMSREN